ncbi:hypothetical protein B0I35DRAFT_361168 [Stachybotrys elegans]|uniref:GST N-terminal domain-containing protein n=1 Tax=Stachybotrys elegans TaxID=80388 RepID=A0A8K0SKE9_9HYPO|nr:hypothetical protein B0I35DRAFT_361168 [Stachybotrys elegans]
MSAEEQPKIKLYWLNTSRAESIIWLLEELKVPYEVEAFHRTRSFMAPPELQKIHPLGKSPVVTVTPPGAGAQPIVLAESGFITKYLCEHFDEGKKLVPARWKEGMEGKYTWLRSNSVPFYVRPITSMVAGQIFQHFLLPNARKNLGMLEEMLTTSGGGYLCGDSLTAADILMSFTFSSGRQLLNELGDWEGGSWAAEFPNLEQYVQRMMAEEGFKKTQEKLEELARCSRCLYRLALVSRRRPVNAGVGASQVAHASTHAPSAQASRTAAERRETAHIHTRARKPHHTPEEASLELFNNVVNAQSDKQPGVSTTPGTVQLTSQVKALMGSSLTTGQKLDVFMTDTLPYLEKLRFHLPRHLYIITHQFVTDTCKAMLNHTTPGARLALTRIFQSLGYTRTQDLNFLVLSICHVLANKQVGPEDRRALTLELVSLWRFISTVRRSSSSRKHHGFVIPNLSALSKALEQESPTVPNMHPATRAVTIGFPQFPGAQAERLVPGFWCTMTLLAQEGDARYLRANAGPLLDLAATAIDFGNLAADVNYIKSIFEGASTFPGQELSELAASVQEHWSDVLSIPEKAPEWRKGPGSSGDASDARIDQKLAWVHKQLQSAHLARNLRVMSQVWRDFNEYINKEPRVLERLPSNPEFLDFWVFVWCAGRVDTRLQETLELINKVGLQPTVRTYTSMMHGWKLRRDKDKIDALWKVLIDSGLPLDNVIWTERISGLMELGEAQRSIEALAQMQTIWKRAHSHDPDTAVAKPQIEVVNAVFKGTLDLDRQAAHALLDWASQEGIEPNVYTFNIMLRDHFRRGDMDGVRSVLKTMHYHGLPPDGATFTIILEEVFGNMEGASSSEIVDAVNLVFEDIKTSGLKPTPETYGKMLYAVASLPESDTAIELIQQHMTSQGLAITSHMVTILIKRIVAQPEPDLQAIQDLLAKHGLDDVSKGDQTLWERVVNAYAVGGDSQRALALFDTLAKVGRPVTSLPSLTGLLNALVERGERSEAQHVVKTVLDNKLRTAESENPRYWKHRFWFMARKFGLMPDADASPPSHNDAAG